MRNLVLTVLLLNSMSIFAMDGKRMAAIAKACRAYGQTESVTECLGNIAAANGWQTKAVPDARVLELLGLGMSWRKVLNKDAASDWMPRGTDENQRHDANVRTGRNVRPTRRMPHRGGMGKMVHGANAQ